MQSKLLSVNNLELSRQEISKIINQITNMKFTMLNNALLNIFKDINKEISRLIQSIDELDYVSLHTRNIFELYLILIHIYDDESKLLRWYGQMHKDLTDLNLGMQKLCKNKNLDISKLNVEQIFLNESLNESPFKSENNFNIKSLAIDSDHGDDYSFLYKLCSKLVHPSSMKVNGYETLTENSNYLNIMIDMGIYFSQKVETFSIRISEELVDKYSGDRIHNYY